MDKGKPIPVILKKKMQDSGPLEVNVGSQRVTRQVSREEHISLDKIVENSESNFYITGKTTKIGLMNFLSLIDKHELDEVDGLDSEDIVVSSDLITRVATATVTDEDEEDMKYIDSFAIGIFATGLLLGVFALITRTVADIKSYALIIALISLGFLSYYTYRGVKSGELKRVARIMIKSLSKK